MVDHPAWVGDGGVPVLPPQAPGEQEDGAADEEAEARSDGAGDLGFLIGLAPILLLLALAG